MKMKDILNKFTFFFFAEVMNNNNKTRYIIYSLHYLYIKWFSFFQLKLGQTKIEIIFHLFTI